MINVSNFGAGVRRGAILAGALALMALRASGAASQSLPLYPLADDSERAFW